MSFCSNCGKELKEGSSFCQYCGAPVNKNNVSRVSQPTANSNIGGNNNLYPFRIKNSMCLASFILGILGFCCSIAGIAALITGLCGLQDFDETKYDNKWMGIFGVVVGIIQAVLTIIALLFRVRM